jgi:hypothetical protein
MDQSLYIYVTFRPQKWEEIILEYHQENIYNNVQPSTIEHVNALVMF